MKKFSSPPKTIGVSTNFLKQFTRQYLSTQESPETLLKFQECVDYVIIPRTQEGKCCVAELEERYKARWTPFLMLTNQKVSFHFAEI